MPYLLRKVVNSVGIFRQRLQIAHPHQVLRALGLEQGIEPAAINPEPVGSRIAFEVDTEVALQDEDPFPWSGKIRRSPGLSVPSQMAFNHCVPFHVGPAMTVSSARTMAYFLITECAAELKCCEKPSQPAAKCTPAESFCVMDSSAIIAAGRTELAELSVFFL